MRLYRRQQHRFLHIGAIQDNLERAVVDEEIELSSEIRLWKIENDTPEPIPQTGLNLEERLENWMAQDIGMVSDDLLVIGQQVETAYGGFIDLLAIDINGNLVILELKRDRTPRDIVAQTLDYASWVKDLRLGEIEKIAADFFEDGTTLEKAFTGKYNNNLPEVVNESHRMYIVASSLDSATDRIVEYLSETHGVDINVATFAYFKTIEGEELLGRTFLLDDTEVQKRSQIRSGSKQARPRSMEELQALAEENGVLDLWHISLSELQPLFDGMIRNRESVGMTGRVDGRNLSCLTIAPKWVPSHLAISISENTRNYFNLPLDGLRDLLASMGKDLQMREDSPELVNYYTYAFDKEDLDKFILFLSNAKKNGQNLT